MGKPFNPESLNSYVETAHHETMERRAVEESAKQIRGEAHIDPDLFTYGSRGDMDQQLENAHWAAHDEIALNGLHGAAEATSGSRRVDTARDGVRKASFTEVIQNAADAIDRPMYNKNVKSGNQKGWAGYLKHETKIDGQTVPNTMRPTNFTRKRFVSWLERVADKKRDNLRKVNHLKRDYGVNNRQPTEYEASQDINQRNNNVRRGLFEKMRLKKVDFDIWVKDTKLKYLSWKFDKIARR